MQNNRQDVLHLYGVMCKYFLHSFLRVIDSGCLQIGAHFGEMVIPSNRFLEHFVWFSKKSKQFNQNDIVSDIAALMLMPSANGPLSKIILGLHLLCHVMPIVECLLGLRWVLLPILKIPEISLSNA